MSIQTGPGGAAAGAGVGAVASRVTEVAARMRSAERENTELAARNRQLLVELEHVR